MENESLKVLDKVSGEGNIYRLVVSLAQRCHDLNRIRLGGQRFNVVEEAFREVLTGHETESEPPATQEVAEELPGA